jgi:hypothetical protein
MGFFNEQNNEQNNGHKTNINNAQSEILLASSAASVAIGCMCLRRYAIGIGNRSGF